MGTTHVLDRIFVWSSIHVCPDCEVVVVTHDLRNELYLDIFNTINDEKYAVLDLEDVENTVRWVRHQLLDLIMERELPCATPIAQRTIEIGGAEV